MELGQTDGAESTIVCRLTQVEGELAQGGLGAQLTLDLEERGRVLGQVLARAWEVIGPATPGQAWGVDSKQLHTTVAPVVY